MERSEALLEPKAGQAVLSEPVPPTALTSSEGSTAGLLLDFGVEVQGFVELITPMMPDQTRMRRVRVRFGESVSEAMAALGGKQNAGNDHAVRDQVVTLPWLGKKRIGPSGFRFVRIDNVDPDLPVQLSEVRAVLQVRDVPQVGSFRCSDERLNRIWEVGAYTVFLNMQEYLWDGIKRDRLVWLGDLHPEVSTIDAVFGFNEVVPRSLDLIREVTPPTAWMNGISSYSMWWVIIQEDWWRHHGNRAYLEAQEGYLRDLLRHLTTFVAEDGRETLDGMRFLDWPTYEDKRAVHEGLQAMMILTMQSGARLMATLGDQETARRCMATEERLKKHHPEASGRKSPAALLALAGAVDARQVAREVLQVGGARDLSTFYGFYVLEALARGGAREAALEILRDYWGGMLDLGATTFWEGFDLAWAENAGRIDELVPPGKKDVHGDCGEHCYVGFRHSLCHGWASGPTPWLSRHVLGVEPLEPGCRKVRVRGWLGPLAWAEGTYPTPQGPIRVRHERGVDGKIKSTVQAPDGVDVEVEEVAEGVAVGLRPVGLRTEYLVNPQGIGTARPRLTWRVESKERGQKQAAYQILVARRAEDLARDVGNLWDSGKVASDETVNIPYQGSALASSQACHWKVRVWDRQGKASEWSEPAAWGMGVLGEGDWRARWISFRDPSALHTNRAELFLPPARHYRRTFHASGSVVRAILHASTLGIGEWHLNGRRVGDAWFEPGWTDYHQRVSYRSHDVTALVQAGTNTLGAIVADGWYAGYVGYGLLVGDGPFRTGRNFYGKTPALMGQLEIEYADGTREVVGTDASWEVSGDGPFREADLIMGETYDARRERADWCSVGGAVDWHWEPAVWAETHGRVPAVFYDTRGAREIDLGFQAPPRIETYAAPPIRVTQELRAVAITEPAPGTYIYDLGQNFAGVVRLALKGAAGARVQIRYGEMLHPDGRLMTENLRRARATDAYVLRGDPAGETWQPRFTYHGFRYVELTGLPVRPPLEAVTGLVLNNDTPLSGEFTCSDELMSRFWKNTQWTQRANFVEIPTDCPQRDERLGWMGDAQVYVRAATFNADVAAFYTKWLRDVAEAQRDFGAYPDYCPYPMAHGAPGQTYGTAWTDAGIICPWTVWRVYGDTRLLERQWASMTRFMEWRRQRAPDLRGRAEGNTWGDWLNVDEPTPLEYIDAAYFKYDADLMAEMAEALHRDEEARAYRELAANIARRFVEDYLGAEGKLKIESQTAHVLALAFHLLPEPAVPRIAEQLAERILKNGTRMATGFLGTRDLLPALSRNGHHDLAVRLFQSRRFPSWGYEVLNGATTVWERWDSYTREYGFNGAHGNQNASMNSFSHYAFGAITAWMFQDLAGIEAVEPGYRRFVLRPGPPSLRSRFKLMSDVAELSWVKATYDSIRGRIRSDWRVDGDRFEWEVEVPANTRALLYVPAASGDTVREGGQPVADASGVTWVRQLRDRAVIEVGSGIYHLTSVLPP